MLLIMTGEPFQFIAYLAEIFKYRFQLGGLRGIVWVKLPVFGSWAVPPNASWQGSGSHGLSESAMILECGPCGRRLAVRSRAACR